MMSDSERTGDDELLAIPRLAERVGVTPRVLRYWEEQGLISPTREHGKLRYADIIPHCHGEVAMADAILALTANMAMAKKERIVFEDAWFDPTKDDVPETKHAKKA